MSTPREQLACRLRRIQQQIGVKADGVLGPETLTASKGGSTSMSAGARRVSVFVRQPRAVVSFEVGSRQQYEGDSVGPRGPAA
jgi:hypothetical protein